MPPSVHGAPRTAEVSVPLAEGSIGVVSMQMSALRPYHTMLARLQVSQMFSIVILQEGKEFLDRLQRMDDFESQDFDNVASSPPNTPWLSH